MRGYNFLCFRIIKKNHLRRQNTALSDKKMPNQEYNQPIHALILFSLLGLGFNTNIFFLSFLSYSKTERTSRESQA